jgi:hypothetical protein
MPMSERRMVRLEELDPVYLKSMWDEDWDSMIKIIHLIYLIRNRNWLFWCYLW